MQQLYKTRTFARWAIKAGLSDEALRVAVSEMSHGLIDADLGGHLVKKRVALPGRGKSGGARVLVATKLVDRWFFLFGFGKSERDNIDQDELKLLRDIAIEFLNATTQQLEQALVAGEILEIHHGH